MTDMPREARLRPECADQYPGIPAGIWMPARDIGSALLLQHLRMATVPPLGNRLLRDEHFEFRGGTSRAGGAWIRTRYGEPDRDTLAPQGA